MKPQGWFSSESYGFLLLILGALAGCAHIKNYPSRGLASLGQGEERCNAEIAREVRAGSARVPRYLYHYGGREILRKDVAERSVPPGDWDEWIMGSKTTWGLPAFRRGLYGTERALRAESFAHREDPGLIRIELKEKCRKPLRVFTTLHLEEDPRFQKWVGSQLFQFKEACVQPSGRLLARNYTEKNPAAETPETKLCEDWINRFFTESKAQVVQDEVVAASWYIRDRDCIKSIEGTDPEFFSWIAEGTFFSSDRCGISDSSLQTFRIYAKTLQRAALAGAFSAGASPMKSLIFRSEQAWAAARLDHPPTSEWVSALVSAYERCGKTGKSEVAELDSAVRDFDGILSGIDFYDQYLRLEGDPPQYLFSKFCRAEARH